MQASEADRADGNSEPEGDGTHGAKDAAAHDA